MSFAHLTLPSQHVQRTTHFFEQTFGYSQVPGPVNSPVETVWLDLGSGQTLHVFYVEGFETSPFEAEFGRHVALFHPLADFDRLKAALTSAGVTFLPEVRPAAFTRFFFREPINGYVFEVIDDAQETRR